MYLPFGFSLTPWVKRLIVLNGAVFLLTSLVPALVPYLAFVPAATLRQPWTLVTYMFVHGGFWHIFFNMIGLFFFGPPLESRWGSNEFLKYYTICGLGGAAFSFVFAPHAAVIGASAAIFGVMLAFAMNWPDAPIYIWGILPIKAKWLVAILVGMQFFSVISGQGGGIAYFAHLGGFVVGFLYLKWDPARHGASLGSGSGGRAWLEKLRQSGGASRRLTLHRRDAPGAPAAQAPRRRAEDHVLDDLDRVLDKISEEGMASLSPEERRLLDEVSRRYRQN